MVCLLLEVSTHQSWHYSNTLLDHLAQCVLYMPYTPHATLPLILSLPPCPLPPYALAYQVWEREGKTDHHPPTHTHQSSPPWPALKRTDTRTVTLFTLYFVCWLNIIFTHIPKVSQNSKFNETIWRIQKFTSTEVQAKYALCSFIRILVDPVITYHSLK